MRRLRLLGRIAGVLTVVIGGVHFGVGVRQYDWPSFDALWFHGSGMALVLTGALTWLASSDRAWRALAVVALAGNLLGVAGAIAFGSMSHWNAPQGPVLLLLFAAGVVGCVPALREP